MTDPIDSSMRLSKRLIELTGCSRREAELYIEGGWVLVDGEIIEEPQFKVTQQRVELHPNAVLTLPEPVTLLVHMAAGQTPEAALLSLKTASRWPDDSSGIRQLKNHFTRLKSLAGLQFGAAGMHVLTQDWRIERKLTEDLSKLEQEYVVEVSGNLKADLTRLNKSVRGCKVSWQNENRLRFALKNPQSGQIEQLCESVGLKIVSMRRIRIGAVSMSKLQPGQWRYLAATERF
jgi:23S rRNA pseudouridine2604 synthase